MSLNDLITNVSNFIVGFLDKLIFWKNFSNFTIYISIAIIVGFIFLFKYIKKNSEPSYKPNTKITGRKFRSRN